MKFIKINNRFSIGADPYNIILKDRERSTNRGYGFYSSAEKAIAGIFTKLEKEAIERGEVGLDINSDYSMAIQRSKELLTVSLTAYLEKELKTIHTGLIECQK